MKRIIATALICALLLPSLCVAEDDHPEWPKGRTKVFFFTGLGTALAGVAIVAYSQAYRENYSDPRVYDQKTITDAADGIRGVGIGFLVVSAGLGTLFAVDKYKEKRSYDVKVDRVGSTNVFMLSRAF